MPQYALQAGMQTPLNQNEVYALPGFLCHVLASAAIEASNDGTAFAALASANTTGVNIASRFIRSTTAGTSVMVKKVASA